MLRTRRTSIMVLLAAASLVGSAGAEDLKVMKARTVKDVQVQLLSESGHWRPGKNTFVLQFTSAKDRAPADVGKATLSTSMVHPGMAPMIAGATLTPDGAGRYRGTINFPDHGGDRQVTVGWDGPAGKGSTKFSVPVR